MTVTQDFGVLKFYDNYVISSINEGESLTIEQSTETIEVILKHFKEKHFVYITHRKHNYTVNSKIFYAVSKIDKLLGFVVVAPEKDSIKKAILENYILDKPFEIFNDLDDAILWANNLCDMNTGIV